MTEVDISPQTENQNISKIPILPVTQMIIDKYTDLPKSTNEDKLLPILSN